MQALRDDIDMVFHSVRVQPRLVLRSLPQTRRKESTRVMDVIIAILKIIGSALWALFRISIIVFAALVLGGFRGAAKSKVKSPGSQ
jgi:hypothetical protein